MKKMVDMTLAELMTLDESRWATMTAHVIARRTNEHRLRNHIRQEWCARKCPHLDHKDFRADHPCCLCEAYENAPLLVVMGADIPKAEKVVRPLHPNMIRKFRRERTAASMRRLDVGPD